MKKNLFRATGDNVMCIARCECGNEMDIEDVGCVDLKKFVAIVCDCGTEFCPVCADSVVECKTCKNTMCPECESITGICEDCRRKGFELK